VCATAFHATDTRAKFQLADINDCHLGALFEQGIAHDIQHLADVSVFARARIQNDHFSH
jgi:hypothetical protein